MVARSETITRALLARDGNVIELTREVGEGGPALTEEVTTSPSLIPVVVADLDRELAELRALGVEVVQEARIARERDVLVGVVRNLHGRLIELQQTLRT